MYYQQLVIFIAYCFFPKVPFVTSITVMPNLIFESRSLFDSETNRTVGDLVKTGRYYRHPDSAQISYPLVVEKPLGHIDRPLNIAVVGGGVAGISAIYELSRLPNASKNINITLFESDYEHFTSQILTNLDVDTMKRRAGRVFAALSSSNDTTNQINHTVYEIGAMRFPEIAGLTWHYASQVFNLTDKAKKFPNPGTVTTEFVQGERVDRYVRDDWLDDKSTTRKLVEQVKFGIMGNASATSKNISLFLIGGKDPAKVSKELVSNQTSPERLKQIQEDWKEFATKYDSLTLESAVRKVIRERHHELQNISGLHSNESKINYYVETFGRFGFGTGGFKALFNTALTEMMRILLWDYATEFMLPVKENVEFVRKLYEKAESNGLKIRAERARVSDVCHLGEGKDTLAAVIFYPINVTEIPNPPPCSEKYLVEESEKSSMKKFDYVILAVTPKQASSIVSRAGFQNVPRQVRLGDYQAEHSPLPDVRPPLILDTKANADAANSQIFSAINQIHMVTSSKVFATIKKPAYDEKVPHFKGDSIKAIVSDCGLATSYIVPSPHQNESVPEEEKFYSLMLSYTWEDDTKALQNEFLKYPKNVGCNSAENEEMIKRIINRATRDVVDPTHNSTVDGKLKYERWWFGQILNESYSKGELTDALSYDWTTHHSSGAFKFDVTGDYYNSHLLFRYHTHAYEAEKLQNRFFLAGDSYSHLGGWIEGAFMSSVNAVCGLIVAANQGNVSALSEEARIVMESFESVASNDSYSM